MLVLGAEPAPWARLFLGRTFVLAVFNAAVFIGIGLVKDGRLTRGLALHALLLACAAYAAATPAIADAATSPGTLAVGGIGWRLFAVRCGGARAGGALGADASRHRRAARRAARTPADAARRVSRTRAKASCRGAVFGGFFMALIQALAFCLALPGVGCLAAQAPLLGVALAGGLLFALRADHRRELRRQPAVLPPPRRERARAGERAARPRGRSRARPRRPPGRCRDLRFRAHRLRPAGRRRGLRGSGSRSATRRRSGAAGASDSGRWRVYTLGALLGGGVGAALGWYFEASQLDVVIRKFGLYAGVDPRVDRRRCALRHLSAVQQVGRDRSRRRLGRREALLRRVACRA